MTFTDVEQKIHQAALEFARKHKKAIANRRTDTRIFVSERNPVSVFMAGSPGAGKTEASIDLLSRLSDDGQKILRIDPDELRCEFEGYTGKNSWLFQGAVSVLVEKIHDCALNKKQSFLLDGTLTNYKKAESNISRSLKKDRVVQILYVYQDPLLAWKFVLARETEEGRRIKPEQFVNQYFTAREVVNSLKLKFGAKIQVDLLLKNNDNSTKTYKANIDQIDKFVPEKYTRTDIESSIGSNIE